MSYVINVRAQTQDEVFRLVGEQMQAKIIAEPKHRHDFETVAQATAEFLSLLEISETDDISVAIAGTLDDDGLYGVSSVGFSVTVQRIPR